MRPGFRLLPGAEHEGHHGQRAGARAGSASGIVATARLSGQATGAALVAFCFTLSDTQGPAYALATAAGFAAVGAVVSFSRQLLRV
ncbi:hypothetical protein DUGA6_62060 [Duganella sp. HH105]|nr:hypothetical protein DUGA6_62060 [Duganella sp. HH105]